MERVSIKKYAATHKLSMFNVVKMVKSGELKSETIEENGKDVTYILSDISSSKDLKAQTTTSVEAETLEKKVSRLEQEMAILKRELDALKISMGIR